MPSVIHATQHMDNTISPPVTRSKQRMNTEVLRSDHMDTSCANISIENVDEFPLTFESPMDIFQSSTILRNPHFEDSSTHTACNNIEVSIQTDLCENSKIEQASQTRVIIYPDSECLDDGMCEDVWPVENCFKSNCTYSELHSNAHTPNSDLLRCTKCQITMCKTCKHHACHDIHYYDIVELKDDLLIDDT